MVEQNLQLEKQSSYPLKYESSLQIVVDLFSDAGISSIPKNTITIIRLAMRLQDKLHPLIDIGYGKPEDYEAICQSIRQGNYELHPSHRGLLISIPNLQVQGYDSKPP